MTTPGPTVIVLALGLAIASGSLGADPAADFRFAMESYRRADFQRARAVLERLTGTAPRNALYWFNLGNADYMLRDFAAAERCFLQLERLHSPLAPAALLYRAKAVRELGDAPRATALLQTLLQMKLPPAIRDEASRDLLALQMPSDGESAGKSALEMYKQKRFKEALRILLASADSEQVPQDRDGALLLKAMIYIQLNRQDEAHEILRTFDGDDHASELHSLVASLLERIRDTYSRPKWLFVETAAGADSNVRRTETAEVGTVLFANVGGGGRLWSQNLWFVNMGYSGHYDEFFGHPDLRVYGHELQATLGRALGTDLFMLSPFFIEESWANVPTRLGSGGRLQLRTGSDRLEVGVTSELEGDRALSASQPYVAGTITRARVYLGSIHYPIYGQIRLDGEKQAIGDQYYSDGTVLPMGFVGWGPSGHLLWRLTREWALDFSLACSWRTYRTLAEPGDQVRRDHEFDFGTRLTRLFKSGPSLYLAMAATRNFSTLNDTATTGENFQRLQWLGGALWDAF